MSVLRFVDSEILNVFCDHQNYERTIVVDKKLPSENIMLDPISKTDRDLNKPLSQLTDHAKYVLKPADKIFRYI